MALPLLPLSLVLQAFDDLYESLLQAPPHKIDLLKPLFQYFENQWIKKDDLKQRNVYGLEIRTNNNAEGFHHFSVLRYFIQSYTILGIHNRLNSRLSKSHPNIWTFIKCIQREENRFNHLMIQMKAGLSTRPKTAKTQAIQQRLDTLYTRYNNSEIVAMELFDGLSYVMTKNISSKKK
ncbi:unnamed protein product [Rotaria sp. Silwood2]|nr:unnamed protein product [Rotaria sp. Silwood2]